MDNGSVILLSEEQFKEVRTVLSENSIYESVEDNITE